MTQDRAEGSYIVIIIIIIIMTKWKGNQRSGYVSLRLFKILRIVSPKRECHGKDSNQSALVPQLLSLVVSPKLHLTFPRCINSSSKCRVILNWHQLGIRGRILFLWNDVIYYGSIVALD